MEHLIFASYGNDSIALIQWAHERGLPGVHVAYGDTGWAAEWWAGRVDQAEARVRTLGLEKSSKENEPFFTYGVSQGKKTSIRLLRPALNQRRSL